MGRQPNLLQHLVNPPVSGSIIHVWHSTQRLFDQLAHRHSWIQRRIGILKYHLTIVSVALPGRAGPINRITVKCELATGFFEQACNGPAQCRFARSGTADQCQYLARVNLQINPVQGTHTRVFSEQSAATGIIDHDLLCLHDGRHVAINLPGRDAARQGREQFAGIRVLRRGNNPGRGTLFNDAAPFHYNDLVGVARDHGQVMADQQDGGLLLARELDHQFQNITLNNGIQCGGRLVCDQQCRPDQHDRGQHDALSHATGEMMRIGGE